MWKRFNRLVALSILGLFLLLAAVNVFEDPLFSFGTPRIGHLNADKPRFSLYVRWAKAFVVRRVDPEHVVAGSSRVELGFRPGHPHHAGTRWYNLGLSGATFYETKRYLDHAMGQGALKEALVGLDFFMFHDATHHEPGYDDAILEPEAEPWDTVALALSSTLLGLSVDTLARQGQEPTYDPESGCGLGTNERKAEARGQRGLFLGAIRKAAARLLRPPAGEGTVSQAELWAQYDAMLEAAHRHGVRMILFLPPAHAWMTQMYREMGLWGEVEAWKRALVAHNEAVAARLGRPPFALWDFTGYGPLVGEPVPLAGDTTTRMRWYYEASHFRSDVGMFVQDRVFGTPGTGLPEGFGVLLTSGTIETHLAQDAAARRRWEDARPEELAALREAIAAARHAAEHPATPETSAPN